jgi:hypothetical protein
MARRHWFIVAGLVALGNSTDAHAFWPNCLKPRAIDTPPPLSPYNPSAPSVTPNPNSETPLVTPKPNPANPSTPTNPSNPSDPLAPVNPLPTNQLAGNDFLGGQGADTFAPNMFGDFFGGAGRTRLLLGGSANKINLNGTAAAPVANTVEVNVNVNLEGNDGTTGAASSFATQLVTILRTDPTVQSAVRSAVSGV